jgi:hypothetical protein
LSAGSADTTPTNSGMEKYKIERTKTTFDGVFVFQMEKARRI